MNDQLKVTSHGENEKKLKKNKNRKLSSTLWLGRHIKDPYVINAKKNGYRSRAAFKLLEINEKFKLLSPKNHGHILDLGSAPGSWLQVLATHCPHAQIIGLDLQNITDISEDFPANVQFFQGDFQDPTFIAQIKAILENPSTKIELDTTTASPLLTATPLPPHSATSLALALIVSDMAPASSGDKKRDHLRIAQLVIDALAFAELHLAPKGNFVAKMFAGEKNKQIFDIATEKFTKVSWFKPNSSYSDSSEIFLVALNKKI